MAIIEIITGEPDEILLLHGFRMHLLQCPLYSKFRAIIIIYIRVFSENISIPLPVSNRNETYLWAL